ncbi:MAG TPA: SIMPL domain-containing protein [Cyclobacteriaceae bacterium]|jgi:uncharacterized protein YggE|nr:SIMPL domain-containing protein [Cyclobacteriaceae bacterium]
MKLLAGFLFLSSFISAVAQTGEKNFIDQNYIEVTGKAEMQIAPDLIYLKIRLSERDKGKPPLPEVERRMVDKLQEIGVDTKKDLSVGDQLSRYRAKAFSTDIVISKEYLLTVHDGKTANKVFLELEKLEISNISVDHLDHTKMQEYRQELKVNAMKAAKEKAEALTKAINQTIGRAIYIQELDNRPIAFEENALRYAYNYRAVGVVSSKQESDLDFEKIKLDYFILTRFELK